MNQWGLARSWLLVLVLSLPPACSPAYAKPARISLAIAVEESILDSLLQPEALRQGLVALASQRWPSLLEVSEEGSPDARAAIRITTNPSSVVVASEITPAQGARRTLRSTLPLGSVAALVPTMAADLAWLWCASQGFAGLEPGPPPPILATLEAAALATLADWEPQGLELIGIASSSEGLTVLFPGRWLTLGPLFRITRETMRDLALQPEPAAVAYISIARGERGTILLDRSDGSSEVVDPLLGTRTTMVASSARQALDGGSSLPGALTAGGTGSLQASDLDAEGNRWTWDMLERRVRVLGAAGGEVFSIKPLIPTSVLPLPQALAVTPDGGFLLAGSGELWKFYDTGVPAWRLARLPGAPGGSLPASFSVAVDRASPGTGDPGAGRIWLLDGPSHRILCFASDRGIVSRRTAGSDPAVAEAEDALAAHLQGMDARKPEDNLRALELSLEAESPLVAFRFAARLKRLGVEEGTARTTAVELAILRSEAAAASRLVEQLASELLHERAAQAADLAVDLARRLRDRDPANPENARLLDSMVARRRELRDTVSEKAGAPSLIATSARLVAQPPEGAGTGLDDRTQGPLGGRVLDVRLSVAAPADRSIREIRVSLALPGWATLPASAEAQNLSAGEIRDLGVQLALDTATARLPSTLPGAALVSWEEQGAARNISLLQQIPVSPTEEPQEVDELARIASASDPFIAAVVDELSDGADDPMASLVAIDALARLSQASLSQRAGQLPAGPAASSPDFPSPSLSPIPSARALLRALPASGPGWNALVAAVLASKRQLIGIVLTGQASAPPDQESVVVVANTGFPLSKAIQLGSIPVENAEILERLSRDGMLCVPLAGPADLPGAQAAEGLARSIAAGMRILRSEAGPLPAMAVRWLPPAARVTSSRYSLPLAFPALPSPPTGDTLLAAILAIPWAGTPKGGEAMDGESRLEH